MTWIRPWILFYNKCQKINLSLLLSMFLIPLSTSSLFPPIASFLNLFISGEGTHLDPWLDSSSSTEKNSFYSNFYPKIIEMILSLLIKHRICSCVNDRSENYSYCCWFYASFLLFILLLELSCCRNYFFFGKELLSMFLFLLKLLISFRSHRPLDCIHEIFTGWPHFGYDFSHFFF